MLAACAADLRKESLVLAALQSQRSQRDEDVNDGRITPTNGSDHIVKVVGWTPTGLAAYANGWHDSYFVVLEKLDRTLADALEEWTAFEREIRRQQRRLR